MRKTPSASCLALCAFCVLSLFGSRAYGQDRDQDRSNEQAKEHSNGIVQDWSRRHVVFPRLGEIRSLIAVQHDPRAILSWQAEEREDWNRWRESRHERGERHVSHASHIDWLIGLGGSMAASMYPAKFTFDPTATPNCIIASGVPIPDFVVFTVDAAGSASQPNIVALQDLYSGTLGGTGICNSQRPTYFTVDTVSSASVFWSYNVHAADGVVSTSPALSLDGTKIAFVEKGAGTSAHFHVLAWNGGSTVVAGDGVVTSNAQRTQSPKSITTFSVTAPTAGSGTATDLALTTGTTQSDTLSSPFVDFVKDVAYVGNDSGVLFRIKDVFCPPPFGCLTGGTPEPSLDTTWNSSGILTIGGTCAGLTGKLTGAVVDSKTGKVFVGCADGNLYGFTPAGVAIPGSPLSVGDASATGGIVDPPLIDAVNGLVYVVSGSSGGSSVLFQAGTSSFTSPAPVKATLGTGGSFNLHAPAFNDAYFSSAFASVANVQGTTNSNTTTGSTSNWQLYEYGASGGLVTLFSVGFNSSHVMTTGAASNSLQFSGSTPAEYSPVTEFLNGSTDQLYVSGQTAATPNLVLYNLTHFAGLFPNVLFPIGPANTIGASLSESGRTTGIIVDNVSASAQASSIYFGTSTANTAVKLTQSAFQ